MRERGAAALLLGGLLAAGLAAGLALGAVPRFEGTWEPVAADEETAADAGGAIAVVDTGWAVRPPAGFARLEQRNRLQWSRDVLLAAGNADRAGGRQHEYITVSRQGLPSGLVAHCAGRAADRGLPGPGETTFRGRRLIRYVCPGTEWSRTHGDSHTWRCLLQIGSRTGIEVAFWSTWLDVTDPARVSRDRDAGLRAFEAVCDSLEPVGGGEAAPRPEERVHGTLGDCQNQPDGFFARVESIHSRGRSFSVFRSSPRETQWRLVQVSSGARVSLEQGGRSVEAAREEVRPADWVRVRQDCATGLATVVAIQRKADGAAGGPEVDLSRFSQRDRQALEREMAAKREEDPWNACFRLRLFQRCVIASR